MTLSNLQQGMSALHLEDTGKKTDVGNSPTERLMYYLYCVDDVNPEAVRAKLKGNLYMINFKKPEQMDRDDKLKLLKLALGPFNIDNIENFIKVDDDDIQSNNEFLSLQELRASITTARIMSAKAVQAEFSKKHHGTIMLYKEKWAHDNFYSAVVQLKQQLENGNDSDSDSDSGKVVCKVS